MYLGPYVTCVVLLKGIGVPHYTYTKTKYIIHFMTVLQPTLDEDMLDGFWLRLHFKV